MYSKPGIQALIVFLVGCLSAAVVNAQEDKAKDEAPTPPETVFRTEHNGQFNGQRLTYIATAGETYLLNKKGEPKASIFTFAYTREDAGELSARPVTFIWNGGPGSASMWLHMGTFGPKRVSIPSDAGHPGNAPYEIVDAIETILDVSDLVFIDPVGTGFSKSLGKHKNREFWGLKEDAKSMAEFIRDWSTDHGRWNSPKFLLGESFGTTRAAAVAKILEDDFLIRLNGLIFVSQALDYAGSSPYLKDNLISYVTYLPTMAAAAWYHNKVDPAPASLESFLLEARKFATDELLPALFKGNHLEAEERLQIRDRLAHFTGLDKDYIEKADLRINGFRFAKELLRDQGLAIGKLDARYTRDDLDDISAETEVDAASSAMKPAFNAALMQYMHNELNIRWDRTYLSSGDDELSKHWRWRTTAEGEAWEPSFVNTARDLSATLRNNPALRVLVASGYYDLITPFFDAEYTLNRHGIRREQIDYRYYGGGHMMYVNEPSRTQLLDDVRKFIHAQTGE